MCVKSPLPTPKFFPQSFSSKKNKPSSRIDKPPPTPRAKLNSSCSSLGHIRSERFLSSKAQRVSFRESKSSLSSKYDSSSDELYFHQCFEIICKLGSGSFGDVFKVRCKEDRRYYAVKRAKEKFTGKSDRNRKMREVQKHEQLPPHPNCVRFHQAWEERQRLYIQTELCCCSLSQFAEENHNISESVIWNYLIDLLLAVKHLHSHNLIHLDIKPDNIFVSEDDVCKLGDFGLVLDLSNSDMMDPVEGDPRYLAPEILKGFFTKAADIFSLGITILELASDLDLPQGDEAWHQLRQLKIPKEFLDGLSSELTDVICRMMEPNHKKRPTVEEILQMKSVEKVCKRRRKSCRKTNTKKSSKGMSPGSAEWGSSISDDVFDKEPSSKCSPSNDSVFQNLSYYDLEDRTFDYSRSIRSGMSTPNNFRYLEPKLLDKSGSPCLSNSKNNSGSPCLSNSKKKGLSPSSNSPKLTKSPRLRLFDDPAPDADFPLIPQRNLLDVFNSLSSEEDSS